MDAASIFAAAKLVLEVIRLAQRAKENLGPYIDMLDRLILKKQSLTAEESAKLKYDRKRLGSTLQEPLAEEQS